MRIAAVLLLVSALLMSAGACDQERTIAGEGAGEGEGAVEDGGRPDSAQRTDAGGVRDATPATDRARPPCEGTWSQTPSVTELPLRGVWQSSAGDVWAVGGKELSVAFVLNGQDAYSDLVDCCWGADPLIGVWGSSAGDVWAIGNNYYRGSVLHFDGTNLTYSDNLGVFSPAWHFRSIWGAGADDIFVVGTRGGIMHKAAGDSWSRMASGVSSDLLDVWGAGPSEVWTVGAGGRVLHWNGVTWEPQLSGVDADLHGVGGSADSDVWAVGAGGTAIHWDGDAWILANVETSRTLRDVLARDPSCAWAVGDDGLVFRWDGERWEGVAHPVTSSTKALQRMWGNQDSIVIVGDQGTTLTLRFQ